MSIEIPVEASLDDSDAQRKLQEFNQRLNDLQQKVAQANGVKIDPVSAKTVEQMNNMIKQFEVMKRLSGEMNRRINVTGQQGRDFTALDWNQMYPTNRGVRDRQMTQVLNALTNQRITPSSPSNPDDDDKPRGRRGRRRNSRAGDADFNPVTSAGRQIVNSGLGALGPIGGVVNSSISAGRSGGFGAGLAGLFGGLAALGIGQAISGVMEKLDTAQQNAIMLDTLKRSIGDASVSFVQLKGDLGNAAADLKLTYGETNKLAQSFANLSNLTDKEVSQLPNELINAGGFSRAFGLDPSVGAGFFGQMRGSRSSGSDTDSRRLAILMGETIAKSGAFAQADKVLASVSQFTARQQAQTLNRANIAGYTGWYSSLVGSGRAGLTPDGASAMLSQVDSAIYQGGAKGEASQFFTGMLGNRLGLNPFQMGILTQGGAFATVKQMFGEGSNAAASGITVPDSLMNSPDANKTMMQLQLEQIKRQYGHMGTEFQANAIMGQFGVNWAQALALSRIDPNQMGEVQGFLGENFRSLNPTAINDISRVVTGSRGDRQGVINGLLSRTGSNALSAEDISLVKSVSGSDVSDDQQKKVLAQVLAKYGQEETEGSVARDSKNLLDNIKTSLADKLVPLTNDIRAGVLSIAGNGKQTPQEILSNMKRLEQKGQTDAVNRKYDAMSADDRKYLSDHALDLLNWGASPAQQRQLAAKRSEAEKRIAEVNKQRNAELDALRKRHDQEWSEFQKAQDSGTLMNGAPMGAPEGTGSGVSSLIGGGSSDGFDPYTTGDIASAHPERGLRNNNPGNIEYAGQRNATRESKGRFAKFNTPFDGVAGMSHQLMRYFTGKTTGQELTTVRQIISTWAPPEENNTKAYIDWISRQLGVGPDDSINLRDPNVMQTLMAGITKMENNGKQPYSQDLMRRGAIDGIARNTPGYNRSVDGGMTSPSGSSGQTLNAQQKVNVGFEPLTVQLQDTRGVPVATPVEASPIVKPAAPFGG